MTQQPPSDEKSRWRLAASADVRLQAQLTAAVAADQRALVLAGLLGAVVVALGGGAASALTNKDDGDNVLGLIALATGIEFIFAMACAVIAARPTAFFLAGATPKHWAKDLATGKPEIDQVTELLLDYDDRIRANDRVMNINGWWLFASALIALCGLAVSAVVLTVHLIWFT
ncbi:hypothetical protein U1707_10225 [Sphingomonas sp. PB2P12]|uniref:hypothetical protein n=1 Tax=Sphingomonas sandaracina TaxID=3096157 RepID=UPI002FCBD221